MPDTLFVVNPDVVYTKLGDHEAVLLNLKTQVYYTLNETGVVVWEMLREPRSIEQLASTLTEGYEVTLEEADTLTRDFVERLAHDGLAVVAGTAA